jgi:ABC-type phosphate/phosphonate transport system ATPase subunit
MNQLRISTREPLQQNFFLSKKHKQSPISHALPRIDAKHTKQKAYDTISSVSQKRLGLQRESIQQLLIRKFKARYIDPNPDFSPPEPDAP